MTCVPLLRPADLIGDFSHIGVWARGLLENGDSVRISGGSTIGFGAAALLNENTWGFLGGHR
ncbi:MAG: hypothetical protein AAFY60_17385 [Myxococcota bacterium]